MINKINNKDAIISLLQDCKDAFSPNTELAFDGIHARFNALNPNAFNGLVFNKVRQLLATEEPFEIWRLATTDFVQPQQIQASKEHPLSLLVLEASDNDGVTLSTQKETLKSYGADQHVTCEETCWFWISPVRNDHMIILVQGRQADE